MFSSDDFKIDSLADLIMFAPIAVFIGLVAPFVVAAYKLGFVMKVVGWLDKD